MPIDDTKLTEGDAFTAARLNTRLSTMRTAVNELDPDDIERKSLGHAHLPGLVKETDLGASPGTSLSGGTGSSPHTYTNVYDTFAVITDGTTPASITWTGRVLGVGSINAILVLANVEVVRVHENNTDSVTGDGETGDPELYSAAIRLAYRDGDGDWNGLDHTERFISGDCNPDTSVTGADNYDKVYGDLPGRWLLTNDVLGETIAGVRLEVAFNDPAAGGTNPRTVELRRYNFTVIPIHAEVA